MRWSERIGLRKETCRSIDPVSRWYGLAYREDFNYVLVFYVIPFNWIVWAALLKVKSV